MASNKTYWQGAGSTTEDDDKRPAGVTVTGLRDDDEPTGKAQAAKGIADKSTKEAGKSTKEGVLAPVYTDSKTGRFLPGNPGGPGRPSKAREMAFLEAIRTSMQPEEVTSYIQKALRLAEEQNSARGIVAVLEFVRDSTIGKPVQRTEPVEDGLEVLFARLRQLRGAE